jgi:hypothetical protein
VELQVSANCFNVDRHHQQMGDPVMNQVPILQYQTQQAEDEEDRAEDNMEGVARGVWDAIRAQSSTAVA